MPEIRAEGLEVSVEEERYLRGAFRRFALPYLVATLLMSGVAIAAISLVSAEPTAGEDEELESLVAEAASLREAIAGLREELHQQASDATGRLDRLETGLAKLESEGPAPGELIGRLDHAHQRISELEGRVSDLAAATATAARSRPQPEPAAPTWSPASPSLP